MLSAPFKYGLKNGSMRMPKEPTREVAYESPGIYLVIYNVFLYAPIMGA